MGRNPGFYLFEWVSFHARFSLSHLVYSGFRLMDCRLLNSTESLLLSQSSQPISLQGWLFIPRWS